MNGEFDFLKENVERIREEMTRAAQAAGRRPEEILLCAACKTRTVEMVRASAALDIDLFGENHVQELVEKTDAGAYLGKPGHMIGHLQTNKVKQVVGRASLIQSLDSQRLLLALEKEAAKRSLIQEVLVEVNIGREESKTGISPEELWPFLEQAAAQPHIRVKGLMAIPPAALDEKESRGYFASMRKLFEQADTLGYPNQSMEILSMGMSDDFANAILEGATLVRVGTAIYGPRYYPPKG